MRHLGKRNIKAFIAFSVIAVFVVAIFIFGITKVLSYDKNVYTVKAGCYLFDESYNPISLEEDGTIYQNWDGKYYLKTKNEKYTLGTESVVYNPNDYRMYTYGAIYQTYDDGTVSKKTGQTEIVKNTDAAFYKLSDRKYLMIDKEIIDSSKDFLVNNFLVVVLDKQGNALLLNDSTNLKILNTLILKSKNFTFDVANEKLKYNGKEIDLKKVIGSSNEYVEKDSSSIKDNTGSSSNNGNSSINNGSTNNVNVSSGDGNSSSGTTTKFQKRVSLKEITPSVTYLDVNYSVIDPANEYESVFLLLSDGVNTSRIQLSKDEIKYRIINLLPNSEYTLSIGYNYKDKDNGDSLIEEVQDVVRVRTAKPDYNITITKISQSRVYFTLKIDPQYKLESGRIVLYSDNTALKAVDIDASAATSTSGWQTYMDISSPGYEILLRLEDTIYNGNNINMNVIARYINY
jgi:hypothetical protein